jgi:phenylacetate-CoA ligase
MSLTVVSAAHSLTPCERVLHWLETTPIYQTPLVQEALAKSVKSDACEWWNLLPFVTKRDWQKNFPANFLPWAGSVEELEDHPEIELDFTSGTSGERTPLVMPRGWWAVQERRALFLNRQVARILDKIPNPRRATLAAPVCNGDVSYLGRPSFADRSVGDILYLSLSANPWLWNEAELDRIAREIALWQPDFLDLDPVYGVVFAKFCSERKLRFPTVKFILSSYEFVSVVHRRMLEEVFAVPVFNLYGSTETGHLLMEDEHHCLRPSRETAFLECIGTSDQGASQLVVTTLSNDVMPLVRYRIGDYVERLSDERGEHFRLLGRVRDAFQVEDRIVTAAEVDGCFANVPGIAHYQLSQVARDEFRLRFIADNEGLDSGKLAVLQEALSKLLGLGSKLVVEEVDQLLGERSGKFRLTIPLAEPTR